ncbi:ATP-binding protein [Desulfurococcus mucosus]|uniref:DNA double-strand break repair protein mre11 n=1 Tax=Desulfurococcus mucosus (strain ATCC 35584 / DSM 2162 / JCM 9187 / O7/1) TaxID=765177 RepID=E8R846_DESM0|nr:DUF87 domain-containing protein [Desulfurococcus mucosus]ADV64672.1 DNA double-strand break repair protein mre11 [Desulfurococcus mucosus DSM 2162]
MAKQVGVTHGWSGDGVRIAVSSPGYLPGLGDLLYVREQDRTLILQVVGFEGGIPAPPASIRVSKPDVLSDVSKEIVAIASLFLEVSSTGGEKRLEKPVRPPALMQPVYLMDPGDPEARGILVEISGLTSGRGTGTVPLAYLRTGSYTGSGVKYVREAGLRVEPGSILSKHVLIVGQTGSGKTSGLKGIMVRYARESSEKTGWLVIDRHGEYAEDCSQERFTWRLYEAFSGNKYLSDTLIKAVRLTGGSGVNDICIQGNLRIYEASLSASSIGLRDFLALLENRVKPELVSEIEEFAEIILQALLNIREEDEKHRSIVGEFLTGDSGDEAEANGNVIALIPLIYSNMIVYEGIGAERKDRTGFLKVLVDRGIYTTHVRTMRRYIRAIMGWRTPRRRLQNSASVYVSVIDDSKSVVKVSPLLKDPNTLSWLLNELAKQLNKMEKAGLGEYPWRKVETGSQQIEFRSIEAGSIDEIVGDVDAGNVVILDVSRLSNEQADLVVLTVVRRLFEQRMTMGVEEAKGRPAVTIVSEEAPLYLSPDKVNSPFNPFARIAREGRKFRVGLIAVTQLASMIEKQILGNFNTVIALRTKSRSDIELLKDIGVPSETLPFLGDREGYIYSPDLPVKEPLPVYIPGWYEEDTRGEGDRIPDARVLLDQGV